MRHLEVLLGLLVIVLVACGGEEELMGADVQTPTGPPIATPCSREDPACTTGTSEPHPGLSEEQARRAVELATQDARVMQLLQGVDYELRGAGVWELRGELTGAAVAIDLNEPLSIDGELPAVDLGVRGSEGNETHIDLPPPYYVERTEHYDIDALSLYISVDLNREKVVAIFPVPFSLDGPPTPD